MSKKRNTMTDSQTTNGHAAGFTPDLETDEPTNTALLGGGGRKCAALGCPAVLPAEHPFRWCDTCRILSAGNAVRLILAPCSPDRLQREREVTHRLLTDMTGMEMLEFFNRLENLYLTTLATKVKHLATTRDKALPQSPTLAEAVEGQRARVNAQCEKANEARRRRNAPTVAKAAKKKASKLETLVGLGMDEATAKSFMEDTYDF